MRKQSARSLAGFTYYGNEDFLLQHGVWYTPTPIPPRARAWRGAPRCCFGNAIVVSAIYELAYVEGYAIRHGIGLPFHHAWNADADGKVFDSTWREPMGMEYFGVEFSAERADDATWNGDATILDDWLRRWPIFTLPWNGEDYTLQWPDSPRLNELRQQAAEMKKITPLPECYKVKSRKSDPCP